MNDYDDERVPREPCRACKNGAHMECFGCGCACNADEPDEAGDEGPTGIAAFHSARHA